MINGWKEEEGRFWSHHRLVFVEGAIRTGGFEPELPGSARPFRGGAAGGGAASAACAAMLATKLNRS